MPTSRIETRKRKKKSKWKKSVLLLIAFLLLIILGIGGYVVYQAYDAASDSYKELDRAGDKSELREEEVTLGDDPMSILLIGVENYQTGGANGRADTQIVVTLNPKTDNVTMTTIPRDTRVVLTEPAEYAGPHKINSTYTYGSLTGYGANKLTVETVESLLNVPIDKYIAVDFEGFLKIVDALGGVTVDIKESFSEKNIFNDNNLVYFEKGPRKLNGEEALAFVRMRKHQANAVYSRDERQRQFIKATIDEAVSAGTIFKIGEISNILGENIQTNLTPREIFALQKEYGSIDPSSIESHELEGQAQTIDGSYFVVPSQAGLTETTNRLREELELSADTPVTSESTTPEISATPE